MLLNHKWYVCRGGVVCGVGSGVCGVWGVVCVVCVWVQPHPMVCLFSSMLAFHHLFAFRHHACLSAHAHSVRVAPSSEAGLTPEGGGGAECVVQSERGV